MARVKDISGMRFGKLTVVRRCENDKAGRAKWECQCDCGSATSVGSYYLTSGNTKSCGCIKTGGQNKVDLTGLRSGRLVAMYFDKSLNGQSYWMCRCDCGKTKSVSMSRIKNIETKSCGCLRSELSAKRLTKHGMAKSNRTATYNSWRAMKERCLNPMYHEYRYYGGRGISICKEWMDFATFFNDMGERPEGLTIDRVDVNGNYCKSNCRWADSVEQQNNKRSRH